MKMRKWEEITLILIFVLLLITPLNLVVRLTNVLRKQWALRVITNRETNSYQLGWVDLWLTIIESIISNITEVFISLRRNQIITLSCLLSVILEGLGKIIPDGKNLKDLRESG